MLERDRQIYLPLSIARRARIVGDHRRSALRLRGRRAPKAKDEEKNKSSR
jgi:hypothetical protein